MHLVIRLLPQDHWHEFIFPSDVTLFECKARALQHFGILDRLETSWQQRPGTPDSKGRILNSSTNGYASSSRHRRRTSLIPTGTLTGDGSQDSLGIADLAKAAEVLASYSLSNVCGGYTHDDQRKIGLACVDFDLLVLQPRQSAILLPLEGFCHSYLQLPCLVSKTTEPQVQDQNRNFRSSSLTVFDNRIWFSRVPQDPQMMASYSLQSTTCTVAPASSTSGPGSKNVLKISLLADGGTLIIKTVKEEDWSTLLEVLGPEGAAVPFTDRQAHLRWREEALRRAQRSNQGLLPPAHSEDNHSEYSLPDSPQRKKDHIRFQDKEDSPSRGGLAYKASRELPIAREQANDVRLQLKRSQSNIQGSLEPSPDIQEGADKILRRSRSFSTPPAQAALYDSGYGGKGSHLRLADLPASPPAPSAIDWAVRSPPKTAVPDLGKERRESASAPLKKLVARNLRYPEREQKVKRWNDRDSDSDF